MPKAFDPDLGYVPCGKLHKPSDLERCQLPEGHEKRDLQTQRARQSRPSTNRPIEESPKHRERTSFLHGILAERLNQQARHHGFYFCVTCLTKYETIEEAWRELTPSHIEPRNDSSTRYERRLEPNFRGDDPDNILVECKACNNAREPQPEFSGS